MFLCQEPSLVFVHIPRTGGTSVERALCDVLGQPFSETYHHPLMVADPAAIAPPLNRWAHHPDRDGLINSKHATAIQLQARTGQAFWESATTFTILRHPLDRLVSVFCIYRQADIYNGHPLRRFRDFRAFLDAVRAGNCEPPDLDRQAGMVADESGALLVKHSLRFESLAEDFRALCRIVGIAEARLPHINRSDRATWRCLYQPDDYEPLFQIYRRDFDVCGLEMKDLAA